MTTTPTGTPRIGAAMMLVAAIAVTAAALGAGVRSTFGGEAAVDEPQYLLTALSLWEDGDLDIADELAAERWRAFHDADLPVQTEVQPGGRQVSPHDPLLPLLLAAPMGLGGWVAAKLALAALAGAVAVLTVWVAVRRFHVRPGLAAAGTGLAVACAPLAVYGQQVYPELPAAGAVLLAVAAGTGSLRGRALVVTGAALVALPWLSVKYVPVAAALGLLVLWRLARAGRVVAVAAFTGAMSLAAVLYLGLHQAWYGGLTVYASGDHFVETGELSVMGTSPDLAGRSLRLVALLVDRTYGLAAWAPVWLLGVVSVAALLRRRPAGGAFLLAPLAAGWAVATWAALTMHGFWWPGRQVVVVLPLMLVAGLWWAQHVAGPRWRRIAAALAAVGVWTYGWLLVDGWNRELTWVSGFDGVDDPVHRVLRTLLPDYRDMSPGDWIGHLIWVAILTGLLALGWRHGRRPATAQQQGPPRTPETGQPTDVAPDRPAPSPELTRA